MTGSRWILWSTCGNILVHRCSSRHRIASSSWRCDGSTPSYRWPATKLVQQLLVGYSKMGSRLCQFLYETPTNYQLLQHHLVVVVNSIYHISSMDLFLNRFCYSTIILVVSLELCIPHINLFIPTRIISLFVSFWTFPHNDSHTYPIPSSVLSYLDKTTFSCFSILRTEFSSKLRLQLVSMLLFNESRNR